MNRENETLWTLKSEYVHRLASQGLRVDNRGAFDYREIYIEPNYVTRSAGSALVKLGNTTVLAGISMDVGQPFPDTPNEGVIMTGAELVPLASPTFEPGPPSEDAIELARVVDRGIRESKAIDLEKLVIEEGEKVWMVFIDLHILDYDGNLFDASTLAAITALLNTKVPKYEDDKVIRNETSMDLPIRRIPVETTFAKIGNAILLDPVLEEEMAADARLTIATTDDGYICAAQKGGSGAITAEDIETIIDKAFEKGDYLRDLINKAKG